MNLNSKISKKFPLESNQNQQANSKNMKKGKQQNKKQTSNKTLNFLKKSHFKSTYLESTYTYQTLSLRASYQNKQRKQSQKGH
jgi:hypothetical protein